MRIHALAPLYDGPLLAPDGGLPGIPGSGQATGETFELSGWWRRAGALIIDSVVLTAMFVPLAFIGFGILGLSLDESGNTSGIDIAVSGVAFLFLIVVWFAVVLLYAPVLMAKTNGATLGKMATGIRVVRADGLPMTFGLAALREIVVKNLGIGIASSFTFGLAYLINFLWPLWDSEHRALHDMAVKTRVVRS